MKEILNKELLKELDEAKKELGILKQSFASLEEKFKSVKSEVKADSMTDMKPTTEDCMNYMKSSMDYMDQKVSYINEMMSSVRQMIYQNADSFYNYTYKHAQNHVPVLTASQMNKLLENCGASEDFEVKKPTLYMSSAKTSRGIEITASFRK